MRFFIKEKKKVKKNPTQKWNAQGEACQVERTMVEELQAVAEEAIA